MLGDWSILGSAIIFGIIIIFSYSTRRPQFTFNKKIKYVHVRTIKF